MKLFSVAALLAAVASTVNALVLNTPSNVVQCQPLLITWNPEGTQGPYFLSVHPGDNPSGAALFSWEGLTGTSFTWTVTVSAGQSIGLLLRDTGGTESRTAAVRVDPGTTTDCSASSSVGSSVVGSSLSTLTGSSSSLLSVSSLPSLTPTPTPTPASTPTRSPSSPSSVRPSTASSSTSTPTGSAGGNTGGAFTNAVSFGSVGLLAALVGAVLA